MKDSLLVKAIRHSDKNLQMPKEKLSDEIISDFEKWISTGAADPRDNSAKIAKQEFDIEKGRQFWSFQPVKMPPVPKVTDTSWPRTDLDRHLLAALEAKNLKPVADADCYTMIRRVYFDLIGLPPPPEVVQKFAKDYAVQPIQRWKGWSINFSPRHNSASAGTTLARCRPIRGIDRQIGQFQLPSRLALPRLRYRRVQRR